VEPFFHPAGTSVSLELEGFHLDASGATFSHSIRDGGARRIDHRHEANKAKVVYLEVDIICVEGKAFGILVLWHEQVAKTWKKRGRKKRTVNTF
uniref:Uncharacterized protein n=1 Tax=Poecilia mexicana TaxID=48701 RepID=A0A3B3YX42_9TELE